MFYLNADATEASAGIIEKDTTASPGTGFIIREHSASNLMRYLTNRSSVNGGVSASAIGTNIWKHWAWVFDGAGADNATRLVLYVNGVVETLTYTGTVPTSLGDAGADTLQVGRNDESAIFYDCKIAHIKIWDAALTASEVRQEMHYFPSVRRRNLRLWSSYGRGSARDYSGNGNHGTITGARSAGGPPQIPHPERFIAQKLRRGGLGLWGHPILPR